MGVKIKERSQEKAMVRIKEKVLADIYSEVQLEQRLSTTDKGQNPDISQLKTNTSKEK